jgi:cytochrome d ubiquinol oxidase subunit II
MLHLNTLWFVIIAVLWVGFFVLEGFDFGVGMLHLRVGRDEPERGLVVSTIGPVGWQRGVAGRGRRRHVCGLPAVVRDDVSALYLAFLLVLAAPMAWRGARDQARRRRWRMR